MGDIRGGAEGGEEWEELVGKISGTEELVLGELGPISTVQGEKREERE